jgi:uncharacterized protein (UPF0332 family)
MSTAPFDWSQFQRLAEELLKEGAERHLRTAISRAYYAIFHLGRARIEQNRFFISRGQDSHKQIWEKFTESADYRCKKMAETAKRLKQKREAADYEPLYANLEKDAPALVALAAQFAKDLAALDSNLPRNTGVQV